MTTKDNGKTWYLFAWPQSDRGEFLAPSSGLMGQYDYTPKDKVVTVKNVGKAPTRATILATGENLDYTQQGQMLTFIIPKGKATSLLDVIKLEWE